MRKVRRQVTLSQEILEKVEKHHQPPVKKFGASFHSESTDGVFREQSEGLVNFYAKTVFSPHGEFAIKNCIIGRKKLQIWVALTSSQLLGVGAAANEHEKRSSQRPVQHGR